jgi:hypothetical protein
LNFGVVSNGTTQGWVYQMGLHFIAKSKIKNCFYLDRSFDNLMGAPIKPPIFFLDLETKAQPLRNY